jgi:hypothetical protein
MGRFRDQLRRARLTLHNELCERAMYIPPSGVTKEVTVRVHDYAKMIGDQKGTSFEYAEMHEQVPKIVFLRSEIEPVRNALISLEGGRAYRIDNVLSPDDITITAEVVVVKPSQAVGLPLPE